MRICRPGLCLSLPRLVFFLPMQSTVTKWNPRSSEISMLWHLLSYSRLQVKYFCKILLTSGCHQYKIQVSDEKRNTQKGTQTMTTATATLKSLHTVSYVRALDLPTVTHMLVVDGRSCWVRDL